VAQNLNERLELARAEIGQLKLFRDSEGFQKLCHGIREQIRARQLSHYGLLPHSLDALISLGSVNSEIAGMETVLKYPDILLDDWKQIEKSLLEQINASEEKGASSLYD
jgi:hypothetical protein